MVRTKRNSKRIFSRIKDILDKTSDSEKQKSLALVQSHRITDEWKAINRAMAAKELGHEHLFEVFFRRAFELGSVPAQDYRDYVLSKLIDG